MIRNQRVFLPPGVRLLLAAAAIPLVACAQEDDSLDASERDLALESEDTDTESSTTGDGTWGQPPDEGKEPGEPGSAVPLVPADLSDDPYDPDYVFDGWQNVDYAWKQPLSEAQKGANQAEHDAAEAALSAEELAAWEKAYHAEWMASTKDARLAAGLPYDDREDLYIVLAPNGSTWRRKKPVDWDTLDLEDAAEELDPIHKLDKLRAEGGHDHAPDGPMMASDLPPAVPVDVWGGDQRVLISDYTGFNMGAAPTESEGGMQNYTSGADFDTNGRLIVNCSGTKISARVVLTAGHCLHAGDGGGFTGQKRWMPGADGVRAKLANSESLAFPHVTRQSQVSVVMWQWADHGWLNFDMGTLVLWDTAGSSHDANCAVSSWPVLNDQSLLGETVNVVGYPGQSQVCAASPLSGDACGGSHYRGNGEITATDSYRLYYLIDATEGQSGGAIFDTYSGTRRTIGIHVYTTPTNNFGLRMNGGKIEFLEGVWDDYEASPCN